MTEQPKHREVFISGSLGQFVAFFEFEQLRSKHFDQYHSNSNRIGAAFRIAGPIRTSPASCFWLIINGVNIVLDDVESGFPSFSGGSWGSINFRPHMSLEEMESEAQRQQTPLAVILGTAEVRAFELPGNRLRIMFNIARFELADAFWTWVDGVLAEMARQGFTINDSQASFQEASTSLSKGGRPRNKNDDWAWQQIHEKNRPLSEVFREWQAKNSESSRVLIDEERSFRNAVRRDRMDRSKRRKPE